MILGLFKSEGLVWTRHLRGKRPEGHVKEEIAAESAGPAPPSEGPTGERQARESTGRELHKQNSYEGNRLVRLYSAERTGPVRGWRSSKLSRVAPRCLGFKANLKHHVGRHKALKKRKWSGRGTRSPVATSTGYRNP
eukprot:jgi/Botrbrau1/3283/Bobra.174_1s0048.1